MLTLLVLGVCAPGPASAAEGTPALDGSVLSLWWVLPFAGLLLSVAAVPQLSPRFWHRHFGKVTAAWALLFLGPFAATQGVALAAGEVLHTALGEYLPFIILVCQRYRASAGMGTVVSMMLPYTVVVLVTWILFFIAWYLIGIPWGPGAPVHL